jgi:hypothetical protein
VRVQYQRRSPATEPDNADIRLLVSLLQQFRNREASDSRDKVYALLSLLPNEVVQTKIQPDYIISVAEVFQNSALIIIQHSQSLSIIAGDLGVQQKYRQDLPSWTPDWSAPASSTVNYSGLYNAACSTKADSVDLLLIGENRLLSVKGHFISSVQDVRYRVDKYEFIQPRKNMPWSTSFAGIWTILCAGIISESSTIRVRAADCHEFWFLLWAWVEYSGQIGDSHTVDYSYLFTNQRVKVLQHLQLIMNQLSNIPIPHTISDKFLWTILGKRRNDITSSPTFLYCRLEYMSQSERIRHCQADMTEQTQILLDEVFAVMSSSVRRATVGRQFLMTHD